MQLWTIIDGEIFMEDSPETVIRQINPDGSDNDVIYKYYIDFSYWWYNTIKYTINQKGFPKKVQFWISTYRDVWTQEENYGDRRIDLEVPILFADNLKT